MKQPTLFIGHGSPMNAIEDNQWSHALESLGTQLVHNKPEAIIIISAHWLTKGTYIAYAEEQFETIHDFGGFPQELYEINYPAPSSHTIAVDIQHRLGLDSTQLTTARGLDHGAWSVLRRLFPDVMIPIIALSIDTYKTPQEHFELAQKLQTLRDERILIIASGNIIHSFEHARFDTYAQPEKWALEFEDLFVKKLKKREFDSLIQFHHLPHWSQAINTAEHYYPLFYTLGTVKDNDMLQIIYQHIDYGAMSMLSFGYM